MLISALIALQILDAMTTYGALKAGGYEANPVLIWLAKRLRSVTDAKWAWLAIAKLFAAGCCLWLANNSTTMSIIVIAVYASVVVNNALLIRRLKP